MFAVIELCQLHHLKYSFQLEVVNPANCDLMNSVNFQHFASLEVIIKIIQNPILILCTEFQRKLGILIFSYFQ
jgi:hypothetical protein